MIGQTLRGNVVHGLIRAYRTVFLGLTYFYLAHERLLLFLVSADASRFLKFPFSR